MRSTAIRRKLKRVRRERLPKTPAHPMGQQVESKLTKPGLASRRLTRRRRNKAARTARRINR